MYNGVHIDFASKDVVNIIRQTGNSYVKLYVITLMRSCV